MKNKIWQTWRISAKNLIHGGQVNEHLGRLIFRQLSTIWWGRRKLPWILSGLRQGGENQGENTRTLSRLGTAYGWLHQRTIGTDQTRKISRILGRRSGRITAYDRNAERTLINGSRSRARTALIMRSIVMSFASHNMDNIILNKVNDSVFLVNSPAPPTA